MLEDSTKKIPGRYRLKFRKSIEVFEHQNREQSPPTPTQAQHANTSLEEPIEVAETSPENHNKTIPARYRLRIRKSIDAFEQQDREQSPPTPTQAHYANTSLDKHHQSADTKASEQQNLQSEACAQAQQEDTSQAPDMSRPPTPSLSFASGNVDRMLEFSFIKELILNSGAIVFSHFVDHRLVFKVHNAGQQQQQPHARRPKYEAVLMGRYRNHAHTIDCFTVLERSASLCYDRHQALEELLEIVEAKLLALPGF